LGFDSLMVLKDWMHPNYELSRTTNTQELIEVCRDRQLAHATQARRISAIRVPEVDCQEGPMSAHGPEEPNDVHQEMPDAEGRVDPPAEEGDVVLTLV